MTNLTFFQRVLNTTQLKQFYEENPAGLKWRSNTIFILSTIGVGMFTDLFLYGLLVPVLPFMLEDRIGIPSSNVQSYTSAMLAIFAVSSVISSPIAGVLADKVPSRQAPFLLGLAVLTFATVLLFLGTTIPVMVVARILQGVSSAVVWTVGLALCIETVGPENLGKSVGTLFSFVAAGSLWSPLLGGVLYKKTGYKGVLGVSCAVLALDFIMRLLMIEKRVAYRYETKDGSSSFNPATSFQDEPNEGSVEANGANERQPLLSKSDSEEEEKEFRLPNKDDQSKWARIAPIIPCLRHPALLTALWTTLMQAALIGSCDATITIVARELFGFDSLKAGILFLPLGLTDLVLGPVFGYLVDRYGTKPMAVFSFVWLVPVLISLRLPHAGGLDQVILYGTLLGLFGVGFSGIGAPSIVEAGAVVDKFHAHNREYFGQNGPYAQLYGLNSMMFNLGLTIGPEIAGELKELIGYGNMNAVLAVVSAVTALLSYLYIGGRPRIWSSKDT